MLHNVCELFHLNNISSNFDFQLWQNKLGHVNVRIFNSVLHSCNRPTISPNNNDVCSICQLGKSHHLPFKFALNKCSVCSNVY